MFFNRKRRIKGAAGAKPQCGSWAEPLLHKDYGKNSRKTGDWDGFYGNKTVLPIDY